MARQETLQSSPIVALAAGKGLFTSVSSEMFGQVSFLCSPVVAVGAGKGLLASVGSEMFGQVSFP